MALKSQERADLVVYRLEKSLKAIEEAKGVGSLGFWTLSANRLYYAAYYASIALLINEGIEASTHRGVIRMISASFVRNGVLTIDDSKLLGRLFAMRQSGDYEDLFDWEKEDVIPLIPEVENYVKRIRRIIYLKEEQSKAGSDS